MDITFLDYINNPMGKQNAVISNREVYRSFYMEKFNKVMVKENGNFETHLYVDGDNYVVHIKIPSEVIKDFYYDVVLYFYPPSKSSVKSIENYYVKFYSNDPSFVYTFAHAFYKNKILIPDLESKMSKEALKTKAKVKNPKDEVGYVKAIYFAYLYMRNKSLFSKLKYIGAEKYNKKRFASAIMNADEKIKLRQEAQEEQTKKKKEPQKRTNLQSKGLGNIKNNSIGVHTTDKVKSVSSSKTSGNIKTTKRSKRS